jgi:uncharacterized protein (TIGR03437 family)
MRIIALAALTVSAYGATYYVSGTGSDANSGRSENTAFATLQTAANLTLPGDTVYIMNGSYTTCTSCDLVDITRSGTPDAWITYTAYAGHKPLLSLGSGWNTINVHGGAAYIVISGLTVVGNLANVTEAQCITDSQLPTPDPACNGNGITVDGRQDGVNKPHHILIENNEVYNTLGGGIGTEEADYITVQDNYVHDTSYYSRYGASGISLYESWNYDNGPMPHSIIRRNRLFNNRSVIPYQNTGKPTDGEGIIIDTSRNNQSGSDPIGPYEGGFLIENNLSVNNGGAGIECYQSDNITFLNNTMYGNGLVVMYADILVNQSGNVNVWNNVVYSVQPGIAVNVFSTPNLQFDYNIYWNGPVEATQGPHDFVVDPRFNAPGTDPTSSDFHVVQDSPAQGSGNFAVAPSDDLEGLSRPQQPGVVNRGAFESVISDSLSFPADGLVNAASYAAGVAPGELVAIFGTGFGASPIALATYQTDGYLPVEVGSTRVYFDGVAAPMIYSSDGQVSSVAPYEISEVTEVQLEYQGLRSQPVPLPVSVALPGIYCYSGGTGQAVAVNTIAGEYGSFNQDQPVLPGGYITFFITGEGLTSAPWADGMLPTGPSFPAPAGEVSVTIGGLVSNCSSNFVGLVYAGVTQVNACVPSSTPSGDAVPLQVIIGGVPSQPGVTVRIGN